PNLEIFSDSHLNTSKTYRTAILRSPGNQCQTTDEGERCFHSMPAFTCPHGDLSFPGFTVREMTIFGLRLVQQQAHHHQIPHFLITPHFDLLKDACQSIKRQSAIIFT
ncbi:MAG: hypothetical protein WCP58_10585, partial [bacterium]